MQNPVTTEAWLTCNGQLLAPLVGLTIETSLFCQSLLRSRLLLVLVVTYTSYAFVGMVTSPVKAFPLLGLSDKFPQTFRYRFFGVTVALIFAYVLVINGSRRLLKRFEDRRTHPV